MNAGTVKDRRKSTSECSCSDAPDMGPELSSALPILFTIGWVRLGIRVGLDGRDLIFIIPRKYCELATNTSQAT